MKTVAQLLGTSNRAWWEDDMPEIATPGQFKDFLITDQPTGTYHHMRVTAMTDTGCDSGRRRYKVECLSCNVVVHEATTGPQWNLRRHVEESK